MDEWLAEQLEKWRAELAAGVVFDWHQAAQAIRAYRCPTAYAVGTEKVCIFKDGKPAERVPFKAIQNHQIELHIPAGLQMDDCPEIWDCYQSKDDFPDWDENTWWPESALEILNKPRE